MDRRNTWGEDRVYFHDDTGRLRRLPAAWTSVAAASPFEVMSAGSSPFRVEDLLQLAVLVGRQVEARQVPGIVAGQRRVSSK